MMNGFQASFDSYCIVYLFEGVAVNTSLKYGFAVFGTFLLALVVELLGHLRKRLATSHFLHDRRVLRALIIPAIYGVNMVGAYWLMLLVMTYEALIFTAIILGLVFGHILVVYNTSPKNIEASNTPCCTA